MGLVLIPVLCDRLVHVKADSSYSTASFIGNGWRIPIFHPNWIPSCVILAVEGFYRECCTAETSPCHPAVAMAAAGQSNYSVGSPLGITQSVSKRPEVNDSCLPWAPGSQSPCRIKITCPVQHLPALDTCKITLLRAGNNRLVANYSKCWLQRAGSRGTCPYPLQLWVVQGRPRLTQYMAT